MTTVTAQALQKLRLKSWLAEATSENRPRGCGRDVLGQTVELFQVWAAATG